MLKCETAQSCSRWRSGVMISSGSAATFIVCPSVWYWCSLRIYLFARWSLFESLPDVKSTCEFNTTSNSHLMHFCAFEDYVKIIKNPFWKSLPVMFFSSQMTLRFVLSVKPNEHKIWHDDLINDTEDDYWHCVFLFLRKVLIQPHFVLLFNCIVQFCIKYFVQPM